jgi:zinc transporter ZupT
LRRPGNAYDHAPDSFRGISFQGTQERNLMDLWMKIGSAVLLVVMLIILIPRAKQMMKESPKGTTSQWVSFLIPIGIVVLFVLFLMQMV